MAKTKMFQVNPEFNMQDMVAQISQMYLAKGFAVTPVAFREGVSIDFRKDDSGIKKFVGMSQVVKANITLNNGTLTINYTDAEWTFKIVAGVVGLLLCMGCIGIALIITAIIGIINQSGLNDKISSDIQMIAGGSMTYDTWQPYQPQPQPQYQSQPQPLMSRCSTCGVQLNSGSKFCKSCGAEQTVQ